MFHNKQKGFGAVLFLVLLPPLLAFFLSVYVGIGFIQFELRLNHSCRQVQLSTQTKTGAFLKKLLALNPEARRLRGEEKAARRAMQSTIGTPAYFAAKANYLRVQLQRRLLDIKQRELIRVSNQLLYLGWHRTQQALKKEHRQFTPELKPLLEVKFELLPSKTPKLAVRPDMSGVAPVYELEWNFADRQALEQKWQYETKIGSPFKALLDGDFKFTKGCSATLKKENDSWVAKIRKVKSLPKSL